MYKLLEISLITVCVTMPQFGVFASEPFNDPLSRNELSTLLINESKSTSNNIILTSTLLGNHGPHYDGHYNLNEMKVTEIDNWHVWHHRDENIKSIILIAKINKAIIVKHLSKQLSSDDFEVAFSGVSDSAAAEMYAKICKIPFDTKYDRSKTKYIWSIQAAPIRIRELCLDFGLHLAAVGITLQERDDLIIRQAGVGPK